MTTCGQRLFPPDHPGVYIGLTNWNLMRAPKFLGLENYQKLLADQRFQGRGVLREQTAGCGN
jgi:phenylalanine-4-hydroxylase